MKIGDLVKGTTNELLGMITKVSIGSKVHVKVYWFALGSNSTGWVRTEGLEVLCK